jgi:tryptophan-rich sensory protein
MSDLSSARARRSVWKPALVATVVAATVAMVGGLLTDIGPWYQNLRKPSWQPPDWVFGPTWTTIFVLAAVSATLAWRSAADAATQRQVVVLFMLNACLNVLWSALFFALRRPDWALWEVGFLWLSIALPMIVTWRLSRAAGLCLLPYLLWVSFAAFLNFIVVRLNAPFG